MPRSRTARLLAAIAILAAIAACAFPRTPNTRDPVTPTPSTGRSGDGADGTTTFAEFQSDLSGAVQTADDYWGSQFRKAGLAFRPIVTVEPYQRSGEVSCAGAAVPLNNALYCPQGDFIAYDIGWAVEQFQTIGDAFLYFLLGHEYAHGIQVRLHITHEFSIDHELQADCMAGAYLGDSVRDGQLQLQDGDLEEFQHGLAAVADDPGQPWFAEDSHGSVEQRTDAFRAGFEQSLRACHLS